MNKKLIAIIIAASICIGAVGAVLIASGDDGDGNINIIDGSGKKISLDAPIDDVLIVNTNAAKAMNILGLNDNVKGLSFSSAASGTKNWEAMKGYFPEAVRTSGYNDITAEEARELAKYVICPVSSMTISKTDQIRSFEELGITIIRLDCNGESMLEDFEKIKILFGETEEVNDAYNAYMDMYNSTVEAVIAKAIENGTVGSEDTFLFLMGRKGTDTDVPGGNFYSQDAELSKTTELLFGKNAIRNTDLSNIGLTIPAGELGTSEKIIQENGERPITKLLVRSTSSNDPSKIWNSNECLLNGSTDRYKDFAEGLGEGVVYTIHTDLLSGPIGYVGYVLIAEACGIDTGLNVTELVEEFNLAYGFNEVSTDYLCEMIYSGGEWTAIPIIVG